MFRSLGGGQAHSVIVKILLRPTFSTFALELFLTKSLDLGFAFIVCGFRFLPDVDKLLALLSRVSIDLDVEDQEKWGRGVVLTLLTIFPDLFTTVMVCPRGIVIEMLNWQASLAPDNVG
jgi:hypothetical protein